MAATVQQNYGILGIAKQSAKGTANTTPDYQLYYAVKPSLKVNQTKVDIAETHGYPIAQDSAIMLIEAMGDTPHYVLPLSIGELLMAVLGRDTKTGSGDPYTHTEDWGASAPTDLPYYTLLKSGFGALYEEYDDCRLNHLKIEGGSGQFLIVTASWVGGVPQFHTSTALARSSVDVTGRIRYTDGAAALKFAGSALPFPNKFTLDIDRGLAVVPADTVTPSDTAASLTSVALTFDYAPPDLALVKHVIYGGDTPSDAAAATTTPYEPAGSPAGISFKFTQAAASPGPERSLTLNIPRVQVDPITDDPDPTPGVLMRTVNVNAYGPASGASPISAVLLNSRATAY